MTTATRGYLVCVSPANSRQAFYGTLANGLGLPFLLIAFGLTSRLLTVATKGGVYQPEVVGRIRFLGWTLIVGEIVTVVLHTIGSVHLYNQLVVGHLTRTLWRPYWQVNWGVLLIGVALLTLTRILHEGVVMREDLEGTI